MRRSAPALPDMSRHGCGLYTKSNAAERKVQRPNMNRRVLRHTRNNIQFLGHNEQFRFALKRALKFFRQNAIYTFIPKNACSTMRLTLAIENGGIRDESEHEWIHANNFTFTARLEDLIRADYAFVILRDPFVRIASCYLDKIMRKHPPVAHMEKWLDTRGLGLDEISFVDFLRFLSSDDMVVADEHWRPQTDFLIFDDYDEYFCIENFEHAVTTLNTKFGIRVVDSRPFLGHGRDQLQQFDSKSDLSLLPISEFARMWSKGQTPALQNLFSEECVDLVKNLYEADIEEYRRRIGPTIFI